MNAVTLQASSPAKGEVDLAPGRLERAAHSSHRVIPKGVGDHASAATAAVA